MPNLTSKLIVQLVDQVSRPARAVAGSVRGLVRTVTDANGETSRGLRAMQRANRAAIADVRGQMVDAVGTAIALGAAIATPIRAAMNFESAMADVRKVVDFETPAQFEAMGRDIRQLSREVPIAAEGLAAMAAAAGQAGIARGDILEFVRAAAMVGTAFDISADAAGDALAHLRTGLDLTTPQAVSLADAMNELSNRQASTAADILDVVTRVGAQAKQFGLTGEQVAALGSAMLSTGQPAEVVATSVRNMGKALTRGESATKRQSEAYAALGLNASDVARRMQVDAVGTIQDVVRRLNALPAHTRAAMSSDLFGDEARALGPLITNQKLLADSLGIVAEQATYAGSAQREYDVRSQTSANRAKLFQNTLRNLAITVGAILIPVMQAVTDVLGPVADMIERVTAAHPGLVRAVAIAVAGLVAFRLAAIASRFASLQMRASVIDAGLAFVGLGRGARRAAAAAASPFRRLRDEARLTGALMRMEGGAGGGLAVWRATVARLASPTRAVALATNVLKFSIRGLLAASGIGLLVLAAGWLIENWSGVLAFFRGFGQGFMAAIAPIRPAIQPVIDGVQAVFGWVRRLIGPVDESGASWTRWGVAAGTFVGQVVVGIANLIGAIGRLLAIAGRIGGAVVNPIGTLASTVGNALARRRAAPPKVGPGRASGGRVEPGTVYPVGERGVELFAPGRSGTVLPNREVQRLAGAGGRTVNFAPTINVQGAADPETTANLVLAKMRREFGAAMRGAYADGDA